MRPLDELHTTTNGAVYRRRLKQVVARKFGICSFCRWHAGVHGLRRARHGHRKLNKTRRGTP
jgi:hypothetical protein